MEILSWGVVSVWWRIVLSCLNQPFLSLYSCANHKRLQGEQAKNIPGESVTEEHYLDHDGNLISRKVMYNFISISHSALKYNPSHREWLNVFIKADTIRSFPPLSTSFCLGQVIRKVIRRVSTPTPDNQGGDRWHRDLQHSPILQEDGSEVGMEIPFNCVPGFKV